MNLFDAVADLSACRRDDPARKQRPVLSTLGVPVEAGQAGGILDPVEIVAISAPDERGRAMPLSRAATRCRSDSLWGFKRVGHALYSLKLKTDRIESTPCAGRSTSRCTCSR